MKRAAPDSRSGPWADKCLLALAGLSVVASGSAEAAPKDWRPPALSVRSSTQAATADEVLSQARRYLGRPYVRGGLGDPGFDCSGFVGRVYAELGIGLPRVSRDQADIGREVALEAVEPGDLLFFAAPGERVSHVAIYAGDGRLIHASTRFGEVREDRLSGGWFQSRWVSARRVLPAPGAPNPDYSQAVRELIEHRRRFAPWRRRANRFAVRSAFDEALDEPGTGVGLRAGLARDEGAKADLLFLPGLRLFWPQVGLRLAATLPLVYREGRWHGTEFQSAADALRLLEAASIGWPGAALSLSVSPRLALSLPDAPIVENYLPFAAAGAWPEWSAERRPTSAALHWRGSSFGVSALVDDVADPDVVAGSLRLPVWGPRLQAMVAGAGGLQRDPLRTGALGLQFWAVRDRMQSLGVAARAYAVHRPAATSPAGQLEANFSRWFAGRSVVVDASAEVHWLGPHAWRAAFGPWRVFDAGARVARGTRRGGGLRTALYGGLRLATSDFVLHVTAGDGLGLLRRPEDQQLWGGVLWRRVPGIPGRALSLRAAAMVRGLRDPVAREIWAQGAAMLSLARWLAVEGRWQWASERALALMLNARWIW